jgi:hypothetical protein
MQKIEQMKDSRYGRFARSKTRVEGVAFASRGIFYVCKHEYRILSFRIGGTSALLGGPALLMRPYVRNVKPAFVRTKGCPCECVSYLLVKLTAVEQRLAALVEFD